MHSLLSASMAALVLAASALPAVAAEPVTRQSAVEFATTVERLKAEIEKRGATIVAVVDHAAAARANGLELRPTTAIIFGNPRLGTPVMASNQAAGLDLPMRIVVWQDAASKTWIGYRRPSELAADHSIKDRDDVIERIAAALDGIAGAAARP
ncbi:MAG: DUF302 domain-containing protein [Alphaproteobacteria bacterium]